MILAGDIGGTKCNLALFAAEESALRVFFKRRYRTRDFTSFEQLIEQFRQDAAVQEAALAGRRIVAAGFGAAGTIVGDCVYTNNLPWGIRASTLAQILELHPEEVALINDLAATAAGVQLLPVKDLVVLNEGVSQPGRNKALLAAGTGLGEVILFWDGEKHRIAASEGGMADFAARTEREIWLLSCMRMRLPHVSCEEVLSGRGFRAIHECLAPDVRHATFDLLAPDSALEITTLALAGSCKACVETLDLWTEAYGAEAGNLALRVLAYGGIYIAGGIAPKILPKMLDGTFVRAFCDKALLHDVLSRIPIYIVRNEDAPLWGAAHEAFSRTNRKSSQLAAR